MDVGVRCAGMRRRRKRDEWATDEHTDQLVELLATQDEHEETTLRRIGHVLDDYHRRELCMMIDRELRLYRPGGDD